MKKISFLHLPVLTAALLFHTAPRATAQDQAPPPPPAPAAEAPDAPRPPDRPQARPQDRPEKPARLAKPDRPAPPRPQTETVTWLGVYSGPVHPLAGAQLGLSEGMGLAVRQVAPGSPAATAGLQEHDILVKLDDQQLVNHAQFQTLVRQKKAGDAIALSILRKANPETLQITLATHDIPLASPRMKGKKMHEHGPDKLHGKIQDRRGEIMSRIQDKKEELRGRMEERRQRDGRPDAGKPGPGPREMKRPGPPEERATRPPEDRPGRMPERPPGGPRPPGPEARDGQAPPPPPPAPPEEIKPADNAL